MTRSSSVGLSCSRGFSLLELNLVVATIAIVALLVAPTRAPADDAQLGLASIKLENALRFARDKASQEQVPYGLALPGDGRRVAVFRIDPATNGVVTDVYNPLTKALYTADLGEEITCEIAWSGTGGLPAPTSVSQDGLAICADTQALLFDPSGVPRCLNPLGVRLQNVEFGIRSARSQARLLIDGYTGRVSKP